MTKTQKMLVGFLVFVVVVLLARFVVFKEQFDTWGENLDNLGAWQDDYKANNLNATKEDMDNDFEAGMEGLKEWQDQYQKDNPGATDAEMDAAFKAAWGQ